MSKKMKHRKRKKAFPCSDEDSISKTKKTPGSVTLDQTNIAFCKKKKKK